MSNVPLDLICLEDVGYVIAQMIVQRQALVNKTLSLSACKLTVRDLASILNHHLTECKFKDSQVSSSSNSCYPFFIILMINRQWIFLISSYFFSLPFFILFYVYRLQLNNIKTEDALKEQSIGAINSIFTFEWIRKHLLS